MKNDLEDGFVFDVNELSRVSDYDLPTFYVSRSNKFSISITSVDSDVPETFIAHVRKGNCFYDFFVNFFRASFVSDSNVM